MSRLQLDPTFRSSFNKVTLRVLAVILLTCPSVLRLAQSVLSRAFVVTLGTFQCFSFVNWVWTFLTKCGILATLTAAEKIADHAKENLHENLEK